MVEIPEQFVAEARELLAVECEAEDAPVIAALCRAGKWDRTIPVIALARHLSAHPPRQSKPRGPSRRQAACATGLRPEELLGDVSLARVEKQPKPSAPLYTDKIAAMMVVRERLGLEPSFALAHSMVLAYEQTLQAPK